MGDDSWSPHFYTSSEDIISSLLELGHQVTYIHNIERFPGKEPLPFSSTFQNSLTTRINTLYLLPTKIVVKKPYSHKIPPQLHDRLSYRHTQCYCDHVIRLCICSCGEEHKSDDWRMHYMSPDSPARCTLCHGSMHPDNYTGY